MLVTTTEKPKAADLSKVEATTKEKRSTDERAVEKRAIEKRAIEKKVTREKAASTVSLPKSDSIKGADSLNSASVSDAQPEFSGLDAIKKEDTEEKAAEAGKKPASRIMVQDANQWRNCRRPHRI